MVLLVVLAIIVLLAKIPKYFILKHIYYFLYLGTRMFDIFEHLS